IERQARLEMSTNGICHYGNRVDCCWGWTRESWGQCKLLISPPYLFDHFYVSVAVCDLGCKHGECVSPDQCRCHQGYTGKTCNQDVNECGLKPRPCKHRCMNMVGSYKCFCLTGYMMSHDGTCSNARTCAMANCQYGCAVMKGEVMCQCPSPGLRLGPDRRTCVDIDECATGMAKCPRFRKCVNTFGSYICKCHKGFELRYINGKYHCTDKNNPCYEKPDSKKCRCKPGTRGWSYDCKLPTTTILITTTIPTTTTAPTTTIPTTTTTAPTTTIPTKTTTPAITIPTTTTTASTTTIPTTTTTALTTTIPTTTTIQTTTTTELTTTIPTTTTTSTVAVTKMTTTLATTRATSTTTLPTTVQLIITTTLDNHIQEITQRQRGDVHIPRNPEQNVFELDFDDIELGNTADFARDDPAAGSLSCSFDQGVCSWMTDQEGDLCWETVADPRGGQYLAVPEPKTGRSFRGARLTIPLTSPPTSPWKESDLCLAFRHRLQGLLIGSLQVFVKRGWGYSPAVWTRASGQGWRQAQITLWGQDIKSVVFKGERQKGRSGEITIDDVSIHRGACRDRD
ncbi:nephronectin precursor, partial [Silurus asotus]